MSLAPILLFVYNRPDHTLRTLDALKQNTLAKESELIIYSDAPKNAGANESVAQVRTLIKNISGFKKVSIIERDRNWGLAPSIIDGVTKTVKEYGKVIVLEDDMLTHPSFLTFMNDGLTKYENDDRVISIHGFIYPVERLPDNFFMRGADCWGWSTWKRGWDLFNADGKMLMAELKERKLTKQFDFNGASAYTNMLQEQIDGKVSSWAVRWYASAFLKDKLTLYPGKSLLKNIGFDIGTHCYGGEDEPIFGTISSEAVKVLDIPVEHSNYGFEQVAKFFRSQKKTLFQRAIAKIKRILAKPRLR